MAVTTGGEGEEVMATINITPFTDVLLVLLIIFIILASVIKEPKLPDAKNKDLVEESQIVVVITDKNKISIGSKQYDVSEIEAPLKQLVDNTNHRYKSVIIKADPKSDFGTIVTVMDKAKDVGLTSFGLANHIEGTKT
jgi:biopolymer transport protein ExbD